MRMMALVTSAFITSSLTAMCILLFLPETISFPTCYFSQGYYYSQSYQVTAYRSVHTGSRRCGWRGWRRCSTYGQQAYYYTNYRQSYATRSVASCCPSFTGPYPNCRPVCNPTCVNGRCTYSNGANVCTCNSGWLGTRCDSDINECLSDGRCHSLAKCINTPGSYWCNCIGGYKFATDGYTCVDVNECTSGNHICQDDKYCHNTIGSYNCSCGPGYLKDETDPRSCNDINECMIGNGGCQQTCVNTNGSYHCQCTLGNYMLNADNKSCNDINECTEGTHNCSRTSHNNFCVNTIGSYNCQCVTGYQKILGICSDINECFSNNGGCSQVCNNTLGSYFCSCYSGYSLNGRYACIDINECEGNHGCHQLCVNTPGSYRCDCSLGYTLADDRINCVLQECSPKLLTPLHGNLSCPDGQVTNTTCNTSCDPGYELSGPSERTCLPNGSWTSPLVTCEPMKCLQLDQLNNGFVRSPCPGHYGSNCSLQCVYGYEVKNGSSSFICDLTSDQNSVQWSNFGTCEKKAICDDTTCVHGKCVEISETEFQCNCTGTLYTGKRCHRSLILLPEIGELRLGSNFDLKITAAVPNDTLTIKFPCGSGGGIFPLTTCDVTFTNNHDTSIVTASAGFVAAIPGFHNLPLQLDGPSAVDYDVPKPITVFVNSGRSSFYYTKLENPFVYSSCCQIPASMPLLKCGMNPRLGIDFKSSCDWIKVEGSLTWKTNGIVFSDYNNIQLPVSLAGLQITKRNSGLSMEVPASSRFSSCGNCNNMLTDLRSITTNNKCYSFKPEPEDLREFVSQQSLPETFISEINLKLLPSWINMTVADDDHAIRRLVEADYRVSIASETQLLQLSGCESVIIDSKGHFSVLLHNGPLDIDLQSPSLEKISLPIPYRGSYYCIAIDLCAGSRSPVFIGVPFIAQNDISRIGFLNDYTRKGWKFQFLSFSFWSHFTHESTSYQFWNGLTNDYTPSILAANMKANLKLDGNFLYQQTNVMLTFNGNMSYKYITRKDEINNIITFGEHTMSILTPIQGNMESLSLQNISSAGYVNYNGDANFSCLSKDIPPNGIALKLSYRVETTQGFFFTLFQLPYDTRYCPVDVFINLNSFKSMNGLSFYSSCLELVYDKLVMGMLSHKFYIPINSSTLCVDTRDFEKYFSSVMSYGLLVQSSLFPSDLSYYQLNSVLKLLSDNDNITMTLGFSQSKKEKVGLLHSVEISVLDGNFVSPIILQNNQLSFIGSAIIFNSDMYLAHIKGTGSTKLSWMKLVFLLEGWFPREKDKFLFILEKNVQKHLQHISQRANSRLATAADEVTSASDSFYIARANLNDAQVKYSKLNKEYQDMITERNRIRANLEAAENALKNATDDLEEVKAAVENLCKVQTCSQVCMETTKTIITVESIHKDEVYQCNSLCPYNELRPIILVRTVKRWRWRFICRLYLSRCRWFVCLRGFCGFKCVPYYFQQPYISYVPFTVQKPCTKKCIRRVFVKSISRTTTKTIPCGRLVPEATCARSNQLCQVQRTSAFTLIDEKREGLTKPLRDRNTAKRNLAIAENKLLKKSVVRDKAQEKVGIAQVFIAQAEERHNATKQLQKEIRESDKIGYHISELLRTSSHISNAFNISNISFSVSHKTTNVPYSFPIDIMYTTNGSKRVFRAIYNFKTAFLAQKDSLVDSIVNHMLNRRHSREVRQKRDSHDEDNNRSGEREFQARCVQLDSLASFLFNLNKTLTASNVTRVKLEKELQATLRRYHSINSSLTSTNFRGNYSTLQQSFNISSQDFEQINNQIEPNEENELSSFVEILEELILNTKDSLTNTESDLIFEWKRDTEVSFQNNYTLGNSICYGFKDCILVFNSELQNMLDFAPDAITNNIHSIIPDAIKYLLLLPSNKSNTFNKTFFHIQSMMNVISVMNKTGYWCAQPPIIITNLPNQINTSVGGTLMINCLGRSLLPLTYLWRKDGVTINGAKNSTLVLPNIRVFDEGNYSCDITNTVGTVSTVNASVHTYQLPRFYLTPKSVVTYIGSGNGALFTCNATSRPDPGWKWFHKFSVTDQWKEIKGEETNELFISQPMMKDIGWYFCMALNYHGNISSDPVHLRLVTVTVRVDSIPVRFIVERQPSTNNIDKRQSRDFKSYVLKYLKEKTLINHDSVKNLTTKTNDNGRTYEVSFLLLSRNTTVNDTGMEPLDKVAGRLQKAVDMLSKDRDRLKMSIENNDTVPAGAGSVYKSLKSSFTVQFTNVLCPKGQELHSNTFLCVDCLEGQYQRNVEMVREFEGQITRELTPVCTPCPENTYQDNVRGEECIQCPDNHITLSTGATAREDCIALCSPNTYSSTGFSPCQPCPKGYYQSEYGEATCLLCRSEEDNIACAIDSCVQKKEIGDCGDSQLRVYYDSLTKTCLPFQYSGCNGNKNNFADFASCSSSCGCPNNGTLRQCSVNPCFVSSCTNFPRAQCLVDNCENCKARFFDSGKEVTDICSCPSNQSLITCPTNCTPTCQNPNPSQCIQPTDCEPSCGCPIGTVLDISNDLCITPSQCDTCNLPISQGPCHGAYPRWFFNVTANQCELFSYGGCEGNSNRFTSLESCNNKCGCSKPGLLFDRKCATDPCKQTNCPAYPNSICEVDKCNSQCTSRYFVLFKEVTNECDICSLPLIVGDCNNNVTRWFFNKDTSRCEQFLYSGCNENANNFNDLHKCLSTCAPCQTSVVQCDTNPCDSVYCSNQLDAVCIANNCGICTFNFYNTTGHDVTEQCTNCPLERPQVNCIANPCQYQKCLKYPEAECTVNVCGECSAQYIINGTDITESCGSLCPIEGQVYKPCVSFCQETCKSILKHEPVVCSETYCKPGCDCPAGQILDEESKKCVYKEDCSCPICEPVPDNCTDIIFPENNTCSCPFCGDCPVKGQTYQESGSCLKTCADPHLLCDRDSLSGCSCPEGQLIDEDNEICVDPKDCPTPDVCDLAPLKGPCNLQIKRYFYNSTSSRCEEFYYGGCYANKNNFFTRHECEDKCSVCPPTCSSQFCATQRGAVCTIPSNKTSCSGNCTLTSCHACYYSYTNLMLPVSALSCPANCPIESNTMRPKGECIKNWGHCVLLAYTDIYREILSHERTSDAFKCWPYPCQ